MCDLTKVVHTLQNLSELDKLKLVLNTVCAENMRLREQLGYKQQNEYVEWWNNIKDIPMI